MMPGHPDWCAQDHRCNLGEHRSDPQTWHLTYGGLVATRVRGAGREWLEVRLMIRLHPDTNLARDTAGRLVVGLDLAVRDALAGRLARVKDQYRRLTGRAVR